MTLPIRVGLVDTTKTIDPALVAAVASALNLQVTRDLPQYWQVHATVSYLPDSDQIPAGVWPVQLVKTLGKDEGGFHLTEHNQPFAKVAASPDNNDWTVDASHETLEMLVDSAGNRLQASEAIQISDRGVIDAPGQFEYLVEVCDPCEADQFGYRIDGYRVSDFITPHYYDASLSVGTRYSFTGAIHRPRQLLEGGYISFFNVARREMQQILWLDPRKPPVLRSLRGESGASLRQFVETQTHYEARQIRADVRKGAPPDTGRDREYRGIVTSAALARAKLYV